MRLSISFVVIIFLTSFSEAMKENRKNHYSFCGFLSRVNCILSRTVSTEHTSNRRVVAGRCCLVVLVGDLVANRVPREWILLENFNHLNDERL